MTMAELRHVGAQDCGTSDDAVQRAAAVRMALDLTRGYPELNDDVGAILDVAEYVRAGKRGLSIAE